MSAWGPYRLARRLLPETASFQPLAEPLGRLIESGARLGYAARGVVYLSVGAIGLLAAFGLTPQAKGAIGALEAWGEWPLGLALLWITGVGLYAFAAWRGLQAIFDADRLGDKPAAVAARAGKALSGAIYAGLAVSLFGLLDAMEDLHEVDDQAATQATVQKVLAMPLGETMVIGLGVLVIVGGIGNAVRALGDHFTETLACDTAGARWAGTLARVGYFARGAVMALAGGATVLAGWRARAAEATGLGGALETLKDQAGGHLALGVAALGFIAFGAFGVVKACLRRIGC